MSIRQIYSKTLETFSVSSFDSADVVLQFPSISTDKYYGTMSSDSLSVSSDMSDPSDVEEAGDAVKVTSVGEVKVVDIPSGNRETASSDEDSDM